jgi:hypothetical protein
MPNPENIEPHKFKKGQSGNPNGRPKKLIGTINHDLEKCGYKEATKEEITSCYLRLLNTDIPEIERMIKDKHQPALIRIVGKAILSGKGFDVIEKVLDRGIGKANQSIDHTTKGESISFNDLLNFGNTSK